MLHSPLVRYAASQLHDIAYNMETLVFILPCFGNAACHTGPLCGIISVHATPLGLCELER